MNDIPSSRSRVSFRRRLRTVVGLLVGLRRHDFRAARTLVANNGVGRPWIRRWLRFLDWSLHQMFCVIPSALQDFTCAKSVSRVPYWLADGNPLDNYPWRNQPDARLPESVDTVVIGAGFTGAALAYHWSKLSPADRSMVVLEMAAPAAGALGANAGTVVMGRHHSLVRGTVLKHLSRVRLELANLQRDQLARQFATVYCRAAYKNAEMIRETIAREGFQCGYVRLGWVQAKDADRQSDLQESVELARSSGFGDWTTLTPQQAAEKCGIVLEHEAGFSQGSAVFHPAQWVWSLLWVALESPQFELFTRTKVLRVEDVGQEYVVHTTRGPIHARSVVNATESYTAMLHPHLRGVIAPVQTQMGYAEGCPASMKDHISVSSDRGFYHRLGEGVCFGSDATRIPDRQAGRNQPSRFITKYVLGEMKARFGPFRCHLTHEWSGTSGFTPDEFPIVGPIDGKRQYIIAGMCGSGTGVSFHAGRCVCEHILGIAGEDYCHHDGSKTLAVRRIL